MGLSYAICLLLDLAIILLYYVEPQISQPQYKLVQNDFNVASDLSQSLFFVGLFSILRIWGFGYVTYSNRYFPANRCTVFLATLGELAIFAVISFQLYLWIIVEGTFKQYRSTGLCASLFWTLMILSLSSTFLQLVTILRFNDRVGQDDEVLERMKFEASSPFRKQVQQNLWRMKWRSLVKHFSKRAKDPTFDAILSLYAHKPGAVESLAETYEKNSKEFEFYLPQLCSFLFLGAFVQSPELCIVLLEKCEKSHIFAFKMLLYLRSFCISSGAYSAEEKYSQVVMLIDEVSSRGKIAAKKLEECNKQPKAAVSPTTSTNLQLSCSEKKEYNTFKVDASFKRKESGSFVSPFQLNSAFIRALTNISSNLRRVAGDERNIKLRLLLSELVDHFFPSNYLYVPIGQSAHRIRQIHVDESFTFSTRERVPYLLCLEVVDVPSHRPPAASPTGALTASLSKKFRLPIFDKSREVSSSMTESMIQSPRSPISPRSPRSPDGDKLGFWSEIKEQDNLKSLLPQASNLINGLIDTLTVKHSNDQEDDIRLSRSTIGDFRASDAQSPTAIYSPQGEGEDDRIVDETILLLEEGKRRLNRKFSPSKSEPPPLIIPTTENNHKRVRTDSPKTGEQDGAKNSEKNSPVKKLRRVDSTDMYLQSLVDEDAKFDVEIRARPDSPTSAHSTGSPTVIFSERWVEKESRYRQFSPFGQEPGWRLIPVIVKSDDDLRQEQFASQLIRQFGNIIKDSKLPVWVRPYDVIATSPTAGLVEAIPDTISLDALKRYDTEYKGLLDFFTRHFGDPSSSSFRKARQNFVKSMAAYSILCYLFQIKDRHNGNILLDAEGHIMHIDFGFILNNNPGNMSFEKAPFKLTDELVELLDGPRSATFRHFRSLCVRTFLVARKYRHRITLLVEMMISGNEHLPCFAGDPRGTVNKLTERFKPEMKTSECETFVHELIDASLNNWRTRWYDKYQRWFVGVY